MSAIDEYEEWPWSGVADLVELLRMAERRSPGAQLVADDVPPMMSMSHAAPQGPWPDEATVAVSELTVRIAKLDHMTKKLLDALEAAAREPSVETDERVCAAIGALRGRPADNPHDWGAWSPVASLALGGRSVQMRQCIYCRTVVMSEHRP